MSFINRNRRPENRAPSAEVVARAEIEAYFRLLDRPGALLRARDVRGALDAALENLLRVPVLLQDPAFRRPGGSFVVQSIPPIEDACRLAPPLGDAQALDAVAQLVDAHVDLVPWADVVDGARDRLRIAQLLLRFLKENPRAHQRTIGRTIGQPQAEIANLLYYMELAGILVREPIRGSYSVSLRDHSDVARLADAEGGKKPSDRR